MLFFFRYLTSKRIFPSYFLTIVHGGFQISGLKQPVPIIRLELILMVLSLCVARLTVKVSGKRKKKIFNFHKIFDGCESFLSDGNFVKKPKERQTLLAFQRSFPACSKE